MKGFIVVSVLAALTVYHVAISVPVEAGIQEDVVEVEESDQVYEKYYNHGDNGRLMKTNNDVLLHEEAFYLPGIPNTVRRWDVIHRGNSSTRINMIRVFNPPVRPGHTHIRFKTTFGHVTFTSAPGGDLNARVQFYGDFGGQN